MQKLGNYFNSELNQWIGENLPKIMTSIDLDLLQVKASRKIIRLAEYKHDKERIGQQQLKALQRLAKIAKIVNRNKTMFEGWTIQVCIIRGNKPYKKIQVHDLITDIKYNFEDSKQISDYLCVNELNN